MWFVYVLYNRTENKIYIGQTGNLEKRLIEHNRKRGNHFTSKSKGHWELVYKEEIEGKHKEKSNLKVIKVVSLLNN